MELFTSLQPNYRVIKSVSPPMPPVFTFSGANSAFIHFRVPVVGNVKETKSHVLHWVLRGVLGCVGCAVSVLLALTEALGVFVVSVNKVWGRRHRHTAQSKTVMTSLSAPRRAERTSLQL